MTGLLLWGTRSHAPGHMLQVTCSRSHGHMVGRQPVKPPPVQSEALMSRAVISALRSDLYCPKPNPNPYYPNPNPYYPNPNPNHYCLTLTRFRAGFTTPTILHKKICGSAFPGRQISPWRDLKGSWKAPASNDDAQGHPLEWEFRVGLTSSEWECVVWGEDLFKGLHCFCSGRVTVPDQSTVGHSEMYWTCLSLSLSPY